jgi:hypothetical protein
MSDDNQGVTIDEQQEILASNTPENALKKFFGQCTKAGLGAAAGQDALPVLAYAVVQAASNGLIGLKDKHVKGQPKSSEPDDAQKAFAAYSKGYAKQAHVGASLKAQESKLRQMIKFGCGTAYDPIEVLDNAIKIHKEMSKAEIPVKPAYAAYVDVARTQTDNDHCGQALTDDELREIMTKPEGEENTVEKVLKAVEKKLEKLIAGDTAGVRDQSDEVIKAHEYITQRLAALIRQQKIKEARAVLVVLQAGLDAA